MNEINYFLNDCDQVDLNEDSVVISFSHKHDINHSEKRYELRFLRLDDISSLTKIRCCEPLWKLNGDKKPPQPHNVKEELKKLLLRSNNNESVFQFVLSKISQLGKKEVLGLIKIQDGFRQTDRQLSYYIKPGRKFLQLEGESHRFINWGGGLGKKSVKIACEFAMLFHEKGPNHIQFNKKTYEIKRNRFSGVISAICDLNNLPSQRLLSRMGMKNILKEDLNNDEMSREIGNMLYFEMSWEQFLYKRDINEKNIIMS